LDVNLTGCS